jgi:hypothetical protein
MEASKSSNRPMCSRGNKFAIGTLHLALGVAMLDWTAASTCRVQNAN